MSQIDLETITFIDNGCMESQPDRYMNITVNTETVIQSWRLSIYSFEWIDEEGVFRAAAEQTKNIQEKRLEVEKNIKNAKPLEKPILGIGLKDNVEIGSGKTTFLTLAAHGVKHIPVHILKSNESDFKDFLA